MTVQELRSHLVKTAREWLGYSEANGKFKGIIDLYNTQRPLPRGYAVQYDDEWCATYVTAVGIQAGLHDIILGGVQLQPDDRAIPGQGLVAGTG